MIQGLDSEAIVSTYEELWSKDSVPNLQSFVKCHAIDNRRLLAEIVRVDHRQRWSTKERRLIESYLIDYPELDEDVDAKLDLVYAEFLELENEFTSIDVESFVSKFSSIADLLRAQIDLHRLTSSFTSEDFKQWSTISGSYGEPLGAKKIDASPGMLIANRYRLLEKIGEGGMGIVWQAVDVTCERQVAIKMLHSRVSSAASDGEALLREGRLAVSSSNSRCAFVFDVGQWNEVGYLVMELLPGRTLHDVCLQTTPLKLPQIVDFILEIIESIEAIHRAGVVHGDIKPSNCFFDASGRIKIGDFGLARFLANQPSDGQAFFGTPAFASPEQVMGRSIDEKTDQYSIGATFYFMLAGRPPFFGSVEQVLRAIRIEPPPSIRQFHKETPLEIEAFINRCLQKRRSQRFPHLLQAWYALLPFSTKATDLSSVGRRMLAYGVDLVILSIIMLFAYCSLIGAIIGIPQISRESSAEVLSLFRQINVAIAIFGIVFEPLYFWILEAKFGASIGKWAMGLRVIGPNGEIPSWRRSFVRVLFIPLGCGVALLDPLVLSLQSSNATGTTLLPLSAWHSFFLPASIAMLQRIPWLLCALPIRAANGFRGWHDILSGTRLVKLPSRSFELTKTDLMDKRNMGRNGKVWGPFHGIDSQPQAIPNGYQLAIDPVLNRSVWIVEVPLDLPELTHQRRQLSRPTRLQWLQSGVNGGLRWHAFAAKRMKMSSVRSGDPVWQDWERARGIVTTLATELRLSSVDGTLPTRLGLDAFFITDEGKPVILDFPSSSGTSSSASVLRMHSASEESARIWFLEVVNSIVSERSMPPDWQALVKILESPSESTLSGQVVSPLTSATKYLESIQAERTVLGWEDRIALAGGTLMVEAWLFTEIILSASFLMVYLFASRLEFAFALYALFILALPMLQPLLLGYNVVFRLLGVTIVNSHGLTADRRKIAFRNFVAWLPWTLGWGITSWGMGLLTLPPELLGVSEEKRISSLIWIATMMCSGLLPFFFLPFFFYCALRNPTQGIQDWLAGTRMYFLTGNRL